MMKGLARAASRPIRRRPATQIRHRDRRQRRVARRRTGRRRNARPAIFRHRRHSLDRHHRGGDRAFAGANPAGDHRAGAGRAADEPVWRRQRREDQRRPPRIRRLRDLQYPGAHQRPKAQRHRHGRCRFFDHSARFDRAHRNHPRQQRRGAVRRQCGRRRHQHRPEERRRRPAGRDPRRSRRRIVQPAHGVGLGRDQFRARGRRRSTATASSPTAIASTTRSTSATASAISTTRRPISRRS